MIVARAVASKSEVVRPARRRIRITFLSREARKNFGLREFYFCELAVYRFKMYSHYIIIIH